jgi:hypothetical protein
MLQIPDIIGSMKEVFQKLRLLINCLWTAMPQERLGGLALQSTQKEIEESRFCVESTVIMAKLFFNYIKLMVTYTDIKINFAMSMQLYAMEMKPAGHSLPMKFAVIHLHKILSTSAYKIYRQLEGIK